MRNDSDKKVSLKCHSDESQNLFLYKTLFEYKEDTESSSAWQLNEEDIHMGMEVYFFFFLSILNKKIKRRNSLYLLFSMVQPTGLEPVTSSFAGRRSNPTELRLHIMLARAL